MVPLRIISLSCCRGGVSHSRVSTSSYSITHLLFLGQQKHKHERAKQQKHRIKEVSDHLERGKLISHRAHSRKRYEHLCTVRQNSLKDAGKSIKYRCRFSWRDAVILCHLRRDRICHNDRHGVVCGGYIHKSNEKSDSELTCSLAAEHTANSVKKRLEAARLADECTERRHKERDHCSLKHARNA